MNERVWSRLAKALRNGMSSVLVEWSEHEGAYRACVFSEDDPDASYGSEYFGETPAEALELLVDAEERR